MAHTPGPWTLTPCSHGGMLVLRGVTAGERWTHPQHSIQIVPDADAYLMAAAPDLLAIAVNVAAFFADTDAPLGAAARAAIAKAEGRA